LEAVEHDSDILDIYCGGWIFFGWVHEMDANCVQKGREPDLGGDIVIKAALFILL